jgi:hypothetical protein
VRCRDPDHRSIPRSGAHDERGRCNPPERSHEQVGRLPDLQLIREDLLLEIERRHRAGASPAELVKLRKQYDELLRRR